MSFNPLEIQDDVIEILKTEVPAFASLSSSRKEKSVREYDDEFKTPDEEWTFDFPVSFVRVVSGKPRNRYVDGTSDEYDYDIVVFIAVKSDEAGMPHILELLKQVRDGLEGQQLTVADQTYQIQTGQFDFIMRNNAVTVYTLDIGTVQAAE